MKKTSEPVFLIVLVVMGLFKAGAEGFEGGNRRVGLIGEGVEVLGGKARDRTNALLLI